ncbi:MAG TPA: site-specific integrase [Bryobacteraceae bacterium]|nr:site-specific integrase [Bryobacteraceae bacterium]
MHGPFELAKKVQRKKMSVRDENRHLDVKREVNFRMSALIEKYRDEYANGKKSADRERSILERIRKEMGTLFVRKVDGPAVQRWYQGLTDSGLCQGTAVRHFNVMHHMMKKACTIWSKETGIDRNPSDLIEVKRPDDQRERYLSVEEIASLMVCLDDMLYQAGTKEFNQTFYRLRMIVLIAITTGMRMVEIFDLTWSDLRYTEGLIAVRSKLKGGRIRYVPMTHELAGELRRYPAILGEERLFPPKRGGKGERQRVEGSFETLLGLAGIQNFRFHDLRHTFASWYMMNGGDLYELAKILGHSNIKMTERYAKLGKNHISKTGGTARAMWDLLNGMKREREAAVV